MWVRNLPTKRSARIPEKIRVFLFSPNFVDIHFYIPISHVYLLKNNSWVVEIFWSIIAPVILSKSKATHHLSGWYFLARSLCFHFTPLASYFSLQHKICNACLLFALTVMSMNLLGNILDLLLASPFIHFDVFLLGVLLLSLSSTLFPSSCSENL